MYKQYLRVYEPEQLKEYRALGWQSRFSYGRGEDGEIGKIHYVFWWSPWSVLLEGSCVHHLLEHTDYFDI